MFIRFDGPGRADIPVRCVLNESCVEYKLRRRPLCAWSPVSRLNGLFYITKLSYGSHPGFRVVQGAL